AQPRRLGPRGGRGAVPRNADGGRDPGPAARKPPPGVRRSREQVRGLGTRWRDRPTDVRAHRHRFTLAPSGAPASPLEPAAMADYQSIMRLRPEVRQFTRNRRWVHRGDVIFYGPNIRCEGFSTDAGGFRHSSFKGESLSVVDCTHRDRYGLVLGPSSVYGFGLAGNEKTMPSLLAERLRFPFPHLRL